MEGVEIALAVANVCLVLVVALQVWEAAKTRRVIEAELAEAAATRQAVEAQAAEAAALRIADHERRKKQATIEFFSNLRLSLADTRAAVESFQGADVMTKGQARDLLNRADDGDPSATEALRALRSYLNSMEWLAVGTDAGVFDEQIVARLGKGSIRATVRQYQCYFEEVRDRRKRPNLYAELEDLDRNLHRGEDEPRSREGGILHS